jgi:hypothetical protein
MEEIIVVSALSAWAGGSSREKSFTVDISTFLVITLAWTVSEDRMSWVRGWEWLRASTVIVVEDAAPSCTVCGQKWRGWRSRG